MPIKSVTLPTAEPIDLAEAKAHLRIPYSSEDALISAWVSAARDYGQHITHKEFVLSRWQQVMDSFPCSSTLFSSYAQTNSRPPNAIYLEKGPVVQVVSITYLDMNGSTQTVDPTTYVVDTSYDPVRITPKFGQIWPPSLPQTASVVVTFDAGYANPFTAVGNTIIAPAGPAYAVGAVIRLSNSGGALPAPLKPRTDYYIQSVAAGNTYTLAATSGGAVIPLTDTGTGTNFIGTIPPGLVAWMKLRLASMYENREELDAAGTIAPLPYADRILDAYITFEF